MAAQRIETDLGGVGRRLSPGAFAANPVGSCLLQQQGVEAHRHVRGQVGRRADFVKQLGRDGTHGNQTAGARMLGDDEAAVGVYLRNGKAHIQV